MLILSIGITCTVDINLIPFIGNVIIMLEMRKIEILVVLIDMIDIGDGFKHYDAQDIDQVEWLINAICVQ